MCCGGIFDVPKLRSELDALEHQQTHPDFWNDTDRARKVVDRINLIKRQIDPLGSLEARITAFVDDLAVAAELGDLDSMREMEQNFASLEKDLSAFELDLLLAGPFDRGNAFLVIHAGVGGTEACDWADMMLRMYQRYSEQQGWKVDIIDHMPGDEVGTKSVTLEIRGENAYGFLKCERGVHRLVRISPFNAQAKRQTSFASVDCTPDSEEEIDIVIKDDDLKVDTYRAGGKGGQNVNKVETAVRITHIPSGVIVACQIERSQPKNRAKALQMLKAKLYQIEEDKRAAELNKQYGEKSDIGWGNQIRSYVFQPYQMVKDLRTGEKTSSIQAVMDGALQPFVEAKLRGKTAGEGDLGDDDL
jgi:peptide chain release factor 2